MPQETHPLTELPRHVAIIMDGNGRWAKARGLPRLSGHKAGAIRVPEIVSAALDLNLKYLTLFAFSTENWRRSKREVLGLMALIRYYLRKELKTALLNGVRLRFIGERARLSPKLQAIMREAEERTSAHSRMTLTIALNYGARDEIARATQKIVQAVADGLIAADQVDEDFFVQFLDTSALPDPDLIIRTSGELRLSNFMLWQAAYAEYAFTKTLWPDFSPQELSDTLAQYASRARRFGGV